MDIIHIDEYFYAVNKPPGIPVSSADTSQSTVLSMLFEEFGESGLRAPHRIDQPVQGLQLIARSVEADRRLSLLFRERKIKKTYWAAVEGEIDEKGELKTFLRQDKKRNRSRVVENGSVGKSASLLFRRVAKTDRYSLVEVWPETGRHHQIRVQLSHAGHPIKGDVKYGARRGNRDRSIHLLARGLEFNHPFTKEPLQLIANPIADVIWGLWPDGS